MVPGTFMMVSFTSNMNALANVRTSLKRRSARPRSVAATDACHTTPATPASPTASTTAAAANAVV